MLDIHFRTLLKRLGLLLLAYMLLRLAFYFSNFWAFSNIALFPTLEAFFYGIRFDLAAIFAINIVFVLLSLLPFHFVRSKLYQKILKVLFFVTNLPFLIFNVVDIEFFKFIGRRTSNEPFTITHDIQEQSGQLLFNYWYLAIPALLFFLLLLKLYPALHAEKQDFKYKIMPRYITLPFMLGLSVLFIRGGLQFKPLRTSHAFIFEEATLGHLSLNSSFTFIKSIGDESLERKSYFKSESEMIKALQFDPYKFMNQAEAPKHTKENVVIIILESFAAEYTGIANDYKGYTPFFDSLAATGLYFDNSYANGRKSIEALPSILAGLPALMDEPYITSTYQSNKIYGIGNILKPAGYHTSFFHGATNGTMGFNNFSKLAGFDAYYGLDEYPAKERDFDGMWGIFDEPYLQYYAHELTRQQQPFLSVLFTLSSHQPYTIPMQYLGKFPKGELEIHESVGYADHALQQFFKAAAKKPWFTNTLFILTADHTQMSSQPKYQNQTGAFRVPIVLYHPGKDLKKMYAANKLVQHADILPTIIDYLDINTNSVLPFGSSMLDTSASGKVIFYSDNQYTMLTNKHITQLSADDQVIVNSLDNTPGNSESENELKEEIKGLVQYYNNGLLDNKLYFWQPNTP